MKAEIENIIYNYADEIPHILIRVINAITLSDSKEELRSAINKIAEETELDKFFAYGYGAHHFWLYHKKNKIKSKSCLFFYHLLFSNTCDNIY